MRSLLRQGVLLLGLAFLPAAGQAIYLRDKVSWHSPVPASEMVTIADARGWGSNAIWIDARPEEEFAKEHVPGAVLLNEDRWNELLPQMLAAWLPEKRVVVYCSSESCGSSREVARRLREEARLKNVFVLEGGWEAWLGEGKMKETSNPPSQGYSESVRERGVGHAVQQAEANAPSTTINHPAREGFRSQFSTIAWRLLAMIIGALFVYAGVLKVWDPVRFAGDIQNYHVLPWALNVRLAFYLPWLEILCGLALIFRRLYSGALALLLALLLVFIGASIAAKARGIDISCGCFGHVSDQLSFAWHLVLDFAILAGVVALWKWDWGNPRVAEQASR